MRDPLFEKTVVVLGFGRQGQALARWLPSIGARVVVSDQRPAEQLRLDRSLYPTVEFVLGGHPDVLLEGCDLLCISGGVSPDLPIVQMALRYDVPVSNDAQLFLERCPARVIGITGSAGKTTTTTLTGAILKRAGGKTWVGGNIGDVLLNVLPVIGRGDYVVMELSSFQLEFMRLSPPLATVLNITPNHLDRHGTMEAYTAAKANILAHQSTIDVALLNRDDPGSSGLEPLVAGDLAHFSLYDLVADGAFLAGERLIVSGRADASGAGTRVFATRGDITLRGDHNLYNVLAAAALTGIAGVDAEVIGAAVADFRGVAHRLEVIRVAGGVTYINDSIATAPERVTAALNAFDEPLILLLGGRDKKLPWEQMLALAARKARAIIAFGEFREGIAEVYERIGGDPRAIALAERMEDAVAVASRSAQPGDVVLLSPGGTSYDAYTDFAERGDHFRALVMGLPTTDQPA